MTRSRRILFINQPVERFNPVTGGAVSTVTFNLANELSELGDDVCIAAPVDDNDVYEGFNFLPIRFHPDRASWVVRKAYGAHRRVNQFDYHLYGLYLRDLRRALKGLTWQPDVVITHNDLYIAGYIRRWLPSSANLQYFHNEITTNSKRPQKLIKCSDHTVAVSHYIRSSVQRSLELESTEVTVALNGVNTSEFHPISSDQANDVGSFVPLRLLFVGRLLRDKGVDLMLTAAERLRNAGVQVEATVIGSAWWWGHDDSKDQYLQGEVLPSLERLGGRWEPHQARGSIPEAMRRHDVVAVLSRFPDPCPLVTMEAMSSGCAVVAANIGGIPEQVRDAAILVPPEDLEAVTSSLMRLATEPAHLEDMKKRARERALERTWHQCALDVSSAIDQALLVRRKTS